ncbi:MAG: tRNA lysidine(34) synthetase TilS [bacterium]
MSAPIEALEAAVADGTLPPGGLLLVACSGGRDSMALLHALASIGRWSLRVATVDHGLHPASAEHAAWVVARAAEAGFEACRLVADPVRVRSGEGPEAAARVERYRLLRAHAGALGAARVVTAHTADDQAETVMMRLGEGTGLRGLGGMRALAGLRARPWLTVSRAAVAAYAAAVGVRWVEDPSNAEERFRRNAVRARVVPGMAAVFGEGWSERCARSVERAQGAQALLEWCVGEAGLGWVEERADAVRVDRAALARLPGGAREALVAHALQRAADRWAPGAGRRIAAHVGRLTALGSVGLPGGLRAQVSEASIRIEPRVGADVAGAPIEVGGPGRYTWGAWRVEVERLPALPGGAAGDFIAAAVAPLPWTLRAARPGDRVRLLGAPGHKAVTRLWRDAGIPPARRAGLPVIEAGGALLWAGGLRAAERARAVPGEPVWRVRLARADEGARDRVESG